MGHAHEEGSGQWKKVNQMHSVISNRDIHFSACRWLLLAVLRPTSLKYDSDVWKANKAQAAALESVVLGGAKRSLGCSSRTCNEAVRGDMGLESLKGRRDKAKLKWWYKLACMKGNRYHTNFSGRFGILNHVEVTRESLGVG